MQNNIDNLYGLIGYPLSHSFSKKYFNEKFSQLKLNNCTYELFPLETIDELSLLLNQYPNFKGLNVTIPYKEKVIPLLNELDASAKEVGAVNTIKIIRKSGIPYLKGYNTDVYGFKQSIKPFLEFHHNKALILGSGGAAKAVAFVFKELGIDYYFVSRSALDLPNYFTYADLNEFIIQSFPLIVNTTPLGTFPAIDKFPPIPYDYLTSSNFLVDLIYNPAETEFLKRGKAKGTMVLNGLSMLHLQAEKAWEIFNLQGI